MICFHSVEILLQVAVSPILSANPMAAVEAQLNNLLFSFNDKLSGIPVGYTEITFPKGREYARIISDHPWLHIDVLTTFVVFKPSIGTHLTGTVNKVLKLMVLMYFLVSLII
jgi:hypothetical protein